MHVSAVIDGKDTILNSDYFVNRQLLWVFLAFVTMAVISFFDAEWTKKYTVFGFYLSLIFLILVFFLGEERNGSQRWLSIFNISLQPSEFVKIFFVLFASILLEKHPKDNQRKTNKNFLITFGIMLLICALLFAQPDFGQAFLLLMTWMILASLTELWGLGLFLTIGFGLIMFVFGMASEDYIQHRLDLFFQDCTVASTDQVCVAKKAFLSGGLFGRGDTGQGEVILRLAEANTDYIFAAIAEQWGLFACGGIIVLYLAILTNCMRRAVMFPSGQFRYLAIAGLSFQYCGQAFIHMLINLGLFPPTGMTLPFISYGGSSMFAYAIAMGILLSYTRIDRFSKQKSMIFEYHPYRS